ncbi:helix-turn-helix transcriptional regulator [Novosphingobium sp. SCN 63-17]
MEKIFPDRESEFHMLDTAKIGEIVRQERKHLGLRQDELAAASGVGLRFIVELERGKPTAQIGKVIAVLAALGCDLQIRRPGADMIAGQSA